MAAPGITPTKRPSGGIVKAFSSLRHPGYRWYFLSGLGMNAAQGIEQLALAWLILDLTGSVGQLGLTIFARGVPMALLGLFGGVLADRYNRRDVLISNQLITLVNMTVLGILVLSDTAAVWHVYVSSLLLGVATSLTAPARQALIRSLVPREDMMNAVALNSLQMNASRVIWPTSAGVFIALSGTGPTFLSCAVLSLIGIVFLIPVKDVREAPGTNGRASPIAQIVEGVRYTFSTPVLSQVMTMVIAMGMFGLIFMQMAPGFARQEMGFDSSETGLFLMASALGSIVGSSLILTVEVKNRLLLFVLLCFGFGGSILALALNPWYAVAFLAMGFFGLFNTNVATVAQTIFQLIVPQQLLGRVMSLFMMAPAVASLATLPLGIVGDEVGLRWAFGAVGLTMMGITILIGFARLLAMKIELPSSEPISVQEASASSG